MSSIRQIVTFTLDNRRFALPLSALEKVILAVDIAPLPKAPDIVMGVIDMHGRIIPVVDIRKRFGLPAHEINLSDQMIISKSATRTVGILVDDVGCVIDLSEDELIDADTILPRMEYVEGVASIKDDIVLIHDIDKFLSLEEERSLSDAIAAATSEKHA